MLLLPFMDQDAFHEIGKHIRRDIVKIAVSRQQFRKLSGAMPGSAGFRDRTRHRLLPLFHTGRKIRQLRLIRFARSWGLTPLLGVSSGVEIIKISCIPASMSVLKG